MNQLKQYFDNFRQWIYSMLGKIEESPQFEKILFAYDGLDPRYQKRVKGGFLIFFGIAVFMIFCAPLLSIFSAKMTHSDYRSLIAEMSRFNASTNVVIKPAPRPAGWTPLPTATIDDVESSLGIFLANKGIPQDLIELTKTGDRIQLKMSEISIRQAVYFVFQIDGWYPALSFEKLKITTSQQKDNLLDFQATLVFDQAEGSKLQSILGVVSTDGSGGATSTNSGGYDPNSSSNSYSNPTDSGYDPSMSGSSDFEYPPPPPPPDDFGNDLPPPPPFEEDI